MFGINGNVNPVQRYEYMIDHISIAISNIETILNIYNNKTLEYQKTTKQVNKKTGELFYYDFYTHFNMEFKFLLDGTKKPRKTYIKGSLHKYFNQGLHNANDFTYNQFLKTIEDLKHNFGIIPFQTKIQSLEYGVNIVPLTYNTTDILKNAFNHKRKSFFDPIGKPYRQSGIPKENVLVLKLYDKAAQYPNQTNTQLLRWENKYSRMRNLNNQGIYNLSDLIKIQSHKYLQNDLIKRFAELLIYDFTINESKLSTVEQKNILNYKNPNYWKELNKRNYKYHKSKLIKIIEQHSEQIQNNLLQVIENKLKTLLPSKKIDPNTPLLGQALIHISKVEIDPNTPLYIKCNKYNKCIVTGIDISMQKTDSFLLSHTGLKYLWNRNRIKYDKVKRLFLSDYWKNSSTDIHIREIAHNIRNLHNNQKSKLERIYPKNQRLLFELPQPKYGITIQ